MFALALAEYFDERGWELTTARDAARALDRVGGRPRPNLIVLDLDLPEGEGMILLQLLKTAPSTRFIPVVAVTASSRSPASCRDVRPSAASTAASNTPNVMLATLAVTARRPLSPASPIRTSGAMPAAPSAIGMRKYVPGSGTPYANESPAERAVANAIAPIARTKAETDPTTGHGLGLTRW